MDKFKKIVSSVFSKIKFDAYCLSIKAVRAFRLGRFSSREKKPVAEIVFDYTRGAHRWAYWCPFCFEAVDPYSPRCICGQMLDWKKVET